MLKLKKVISMVLIAAMAGTLWVPVSFPSSGAAAASGDPWNDSAAWPKLTAKNNLVPGTKYFSLNEWKGTVSPDVTGKNTQQSQIFSVNEEDTHSDGTLAYATVENARLGTLNYNLDLGYYKLLTGSEKQWDLTVVKNEAEAKSSGLADNFYKTNFDVSSQAAYSGNGQIATSKTAVYEGWKKVTLPASWQTQGFDFPIYTNVAYPWPNAYGNGGMTVPQAPTVFNPIGFYRSSFTVDPSWLQNGFKVFLNFDGVESSMYLYINGQEVGYGEGTYQKHEFDVTPFLKTDGSENVLAVRVQRWSDNSFGEDQDTFRLAGIFRDVYLTAAPAVNIQDYKVETDLNDDFVNATLKTSFQVRNQSTAAISNYGIDVKLFDVSGTDILASAPVRGTVSEIASDGKTTVQLSTPVQNPRKWSDESPYLYIMVATLYDKTTGKHFESISKQVGFREITFTKTAVDGSYNKITDSYEQVKINGQRLLFRGVNRHDADYETGRYVSKEDYLNDLILMKQYNINAIRTSHYPNDPYFYYLCNKMGFLVMAEAGFECHGLGDADVLQPYLENYYRRTLEFNVQSKKNDPSVVMWSLGNEAGRSNNSKMFQKALQEVLRPIDNTRLVHFEPLDDAGGVDVASRMYPGLSSLNAYGTRSDSMPFVMCEYDHAIGNEIGVLDEHWNLVRKYPNFMGGFIWDWGDKSLAMEIPNKYTEIKTDKSPNNFVGKLNGAVVEDTSSPVGKSLTGYMSVPASLNETGEKINDALSGNNPFTLEMTVKQNSDNERLNTLIAKGDSQFVLRSTKNEGITFFTRTNNGWKESCYEFPQNWLGNWHRIAAVFDGKNYQVYCDGILLKKLSGDGGIGEGNSILKSNYDLSVSFEPEKGLIGDNSVALVRVYSKALTKAELDTQGAADASGTGYAYDASNAAVLLWLDFSAAATQNKTSDALDYYKGTDMEGKFFAYGGDFGDSPNDGDFCATGMISAKGEVQPELYEVKYQYQKIWITGDYSQILKKQVAIYNESSFTNLNAYEFTWSLLEDGVKIGTGKLNVDCAPGKTQTVTVPFVMPDTLKPDGEYYLNISVSLKEDTLWADAGHEIAYTQIKVPAAVSHVPGIDVSACPIINKTETADEIILTGSAFTAKFNKTTGIISHYEYNGNTLITKGPAPSYWRASTNNDPYVSDSGWENANKNISATVETASASGGKSFIITVTQTLTNAKSSKQYLTYTVYGSGEITVQSKLTPNPEMKDLLTVGTSITLPMSYDNVTYYGLGAQDCYSDRKSGGMVGIYKTTATESFFPYIKPQESGNKMGVRYVGIEDPAKDTGLLVVGKQNLNVSALHYSYEDYKDVRHTYQMPQPNKTVLDIDLVSAGLGYATNGPSGDAYRVTSKNEYSYEYTLIPYSKTTDTIMDISKQWRDADSFNQNAFDKEEAAKADALISSIGVVLSYNQKGDIVAARKAYDKLTEAQKQLVAGYKILTDAESAIKNLYGAKAYIRDQSMNRLDGEITDTAKILKDSTSPTGYAMQGYFAVPNTGLINQKLSGGNAFTLEVWVNPADLSNGNTFIAKGDTQTTIKTSNDGLEFFVHGQNDRRWHVLNPAYPAGWVAGTWHHVVGTFDGNMISLYVDGQLLLSNTVGDTVATNNDPLGIGKCLDSPNSDKFLRGKLGAAHVYTKALSLSEISNLYRKGKGETVTTIKSTDKNVLLWYDFTEFSSEGGTAEPVTVAGVEPVTVTTTVGVAPVLPGSVSVKYSDGSVGTKPVAWESVHPSRYASAGSFTVYGTVENIDIPATASVTVLDVLLGDIDNDTKVNISDVVALRGIIMKGTHTDSQRTAGDFDKDNKLTVTDVVALRSYIIKGIN